MHKRLSVKDPLVCFLFICCSLVKRCIVTSEKRKRYEKIRFEYLITLFKINKTKCTSASIGANKTTTPHSYEMTSK